MSVKVSATLKIDVDVLDNDIPDDELKDRLTRYIKDEQTLLYSKMSEYSFVANAKLTRVTVKRD